MAVLYLLVMTDNQLSNLTAFVNRYFLQLTKILKMYNSDFDTLKSRFLYYPSAGKVSVKFKNKTLFINQNFLFQGQYQNLVFKAQNPGFVTQSIKKVFVKHFNLTSNPFENT